MARMATASVKSPNAADTTAATIRTTTSVADSCSHSIRHTLFWPRSASSLGPCSAKRSRAASTDKPEPTLVPSAAAASLPESVCQGAAAGGARCGMAGVGVVGIRT